MVSINLFTAWEILRFNNFKDHFYQFWIDLFISRYIFAYTNNLYIWSKILKKFRFKKWNRELKRIILRKWKLKYSTKLLWRLSQSLILWWIQSIDKILIILSWFIFNNNLCYSVQKTEWNMKSYLSIFSMINYWWFQNFDRIEEKEYFWNHYKKRFRRILIISRYLQTKILSSSPSIFVFQFFSKRMHSFQRNEFQLIQNDLAFFLTKNVEMIW